MGSEMCIRDSRESQRKSGVDRKIKISMCVYRWGLAHARWHSGSGKTVKISSTVGRAERNGDTAIERESGVVKVYDLVDERKPLAGEANASLSIGESDDRRCVCVA